MVVRCSWAYLNLEERRDESSVDARYPRSWKNSLRLHDGGKAKAILENRALCIFELPTNPCDTAFDSTFPHVPTRHR